MQCDDKNSVTEEEINATIDCMLAEDERERLAQHNNRGNFSLRCPCRKSTCVENFKRFSICVMEAMQELNRQRQIKSKSPSLCSTTCEIVNYIIKNFIHEGDVDAQVRATLRELCCQGFVKKEGSDLYRLIGPNACRILKTECKINRSSPALTNSWKPKRLKKPRSVRSRKSKRNSSPCKRSNQRQRDRSNNSSDMDLSLPSNLEMEVQKSPSNNSINEIKIVEDHFDNASNNSTAYETARSEHSNDERQRAGGSQQGLYNFDRNMDESRSNSSANNENPNEVIGAIENPIRSLNIEPEFNDTGSDIEIIIPDESDLDKFNNKNYKESDDETDDNDCNSDDSVLQDIKNNNSSNTHDESHDLELKRWIKNCRREYAQRNMVGDLTDDE